MIAISLGKRTILQMHSLTLVIVDPLTVLGLDHFRNRIHLLPKSQIIQVTLSQLMLNDYYQIV